jgi:hypothetical protein
MLGVRLGVVGILAREDVKVLAVYVEYPAYKTNTKSKPALKAPA